jgi:arsenate reductase-like glutaredoxin family protein
MKENPPRRDEALVLMAANPNLIKRPLILDGTKILFGFKPEEWSSL